MTETGKDFFFAEWEGRKIFCVYHYPLLKDLIRQVLYVHPLGDEMNKSRRIISLQAEAFASKGIATLVIDLFGCGDSEGEFSDTRWEIWFENIKAAHKWLEHKSDVPITYWGLRLGCLLITDYIQRSQLPRTDLIFWQPITEGKSAVQLLKRQYSLSGFIGNKQKNDFDTVLQEKDFLEISGYQFNRDLIIDIQSIDMIQENTGFINSVIWKEISMMDRKELSYPSKRVVSFWSTSRVNVHWEVLTGKPFWNTIDIEVCPALIEATLESMLNYFPSS